MMRQTNLKRAARFLGTLGLFGFTALTGCATTRQVPIDCLPPEGTEKAIVVTTAQDKYQFRHVRVDGPNLVGTYLATEERIISGGSISYVDVERTTLLPLSLVDHIEVKQIDYANTALLGAGATLFAIWANSLSDSPAEPTQTRYGPGDKGGGGQPIQ